MTIDKALEHFEWKLKNTWKATEKDIEAYNSMVKYKQTVDDVNLQENENLAKLWIHQLMLLNNTEMYSAEQAIKAIDEILDKSVYEWCLELKDKMSIMRFNALLKQNAGDVKLLETLKTDISEDDIIKFVKKQITRIIFLYEK